MKKIKIVADSSCDIFELKHVEFETAPLKVITADREFIDDASLDIDDMVDYLYRLKGKSKSSCPNTADWMNTFGDADEIYCVTITSGLSGSYNSACAAKQIYESENEGKRVHVFDSLSAGPEITLIIEKIEECIGNGMSFEEVCESVTAYKKNTGLVFMLKSLKNFANNGRVSPLVAKLVGIAGICIVGKASDEGTLEPLHKPRGENHALKTLLNSLISEGYNGGKVSIGHCRNEAAAKQLKELITSKFANAQIDIHKFRGLCSFYAEKGGILVGFEKA